MGPNELEQKLKEILGDFVTITNPRDIKPGESWEISEEDIKEAMSASRNITYAKGVILERAVEIESTLDSILKRLFFGKNYESSDLFEDLILKTNFFSMQNKLNVFKRLVKQHETLKTNDYSSLFKEIQEFIEVRNRFAHGAIVFKHVQPFLSYKGDREDELTLEYFEKIANSFKQIFSELRKIQMLLESEKR
jgi:hypothetical protein